LDLLEVGVRYDEFNKKLYTNNTGDKIFDNVEVVDELALHLSKRIALVWTTEFSMAALREEIALRAKHNTFHPVQERLNGLNWDGKPRVKNWLPIYLGVEITDDKREYIYAVGEMFLLQMVARIYQPGCKADYVLILEGPQGRKKSTALEVLAGEDWFSDDLPPLTEKDAKLHLRGKWLVELGEIKRTLRVDPETFKAFQTRKVDRYRPPYGRTDIDQPRQCVFAGTVNSDEYFTDETGNRRGWPVMCGIIDIEKLVADRDQLFAEAVVLYRQGRHWWPDTDFEEKHFMPQQEARQIETAFDQEVQRILRRCDDKRRVTLNFVSGLVKDKYRNIKDYLLWRAMKLAGWKSVRSKIPNTKRDERYWVRTDTAEPYVPPTGTDPEDEYAQKVRKALNEEEPY
jgi:predicted P-loop ATPase